MIFEMYVCIWIEREETNSSCSIIYYLLCGSHPSCTKGEKGGGIIGLDEDLIRSQREVVMKCIPSKHTFRKRLQYLPTKQQQMISRKMEL